MPGWRFYSPVTPLPYTPADVMARYPQVTNINQVSEIRPHAISPLGRYIAGTCNTNSSAKARGFVLKMKNFGTPLVYSLETPDVPLVQGTDVISLRGVNDAGDVVGFCVRTNEAQGTARPFVSFRTATGRVSYSPAFPARIGATLGTIWSIDSSRNVTGTCLIGTINVGFHARLNPYGQFIASAFVLDATTETIKNRYPLAGMLAQRDNGSGSQPYYSGAWILPPLLNPVAITVTGQSVTANSLNMTNEVAGFTGSSGSWRGGLWRVNALQAVSHYDFSTYLSGIGIPKQCRLWGKSLLGTIVGTIDRTEPFIITGHYS